MDQRDQKNLQEVCFFSQPVNQGLKRASLQTRSNYWETGETSSLSFFPKLHRKLDSKVRLFNFRKFPFPNNPQNPGRSSKTQFDQWRTSSPTNDCWILENQKALIPINWSRFSRTPREVPAIKRENLKIRFESNGKRTEIKTSDHGRLKVFNGELANAYIQIWNEDFDAVPRLI